MRFLRTFSYKLLLLLLSFINEECEDNGYHACFQKLLKLPESRKHITHYLTSPDHFERKKYEETLPVTKTVKVRQVTHNARTSDRQKLRHKMYAIEIT